MKEMLQEYNEELSRVTHSIHLDSERTDTEDIRKQVTEVYIHKLFERLELVHPGLGSENQDKIKGFLNDIEYE
jgi:hypothetical protein